MSKTILITGSTDGIGLATAEMLVPMGHQIIVHGRNPEKVKKTKAMLKEISPQSKVDGFVADLSSLKQVNTFAHEVLAKYKKIDVLINNAGVYVANNAVTQDGLELRFAVNTIAPYFLTKLLLPIIDSEGRVVNLSSAAQSPVNIKALSKATRMSDGDAYAQSKLAITMWSFAMANELKASDGPSIIAVNPKSFLGSKMVHQAYGTKGYDLRIGADILTRASLSDEFKNASGKYFDNDSGQFAYPHPDAMDERKCQEVVSCMDQIIENI